MYILLICYGILVNICLAATCSCMCMDYLVCIISFFRNFSLNYSNLVCPLGPKLEIKLLLLLLLYNYILSMDLVCNDEISKIFKIIEITCT